VNVGVISSVSLEAAVENVCEVPDWTTAKISTWLLGCLCCVWVLIRLFEAGVVIVAE
jgi:hypothetical protein